MKFYKGRLSKLLFPLLTFILLFFSTFQKANAEIEYPAPTNCKYINDYVGILDKSTKEYLISVGNELETKTGAQAVIVIVNSIEDYEIRDYGNKLFRKWGIGQKNKDNGLLILMSIKDKKWSVEVGRGLEGVVPDTLSNRIMEKVAVIEFKKNNYDQGLKNAYSVFADTISEEYGVTLEKNESVNFNYNSNQGKKPFIPMIFIGIILMDVIFNKGRIIRAILELFSNNSHFGGGNGGFGGGNGGFGGGTFGGGNSSGGGFGGGSSSGGGSSGSW